MSVEPYAEVLPLLPEAALIVTSGGRVVGANAAAVRVLGAAPVGRALADLVRTPGDDVARLVQASARTREPVLGALEVGEARYRVSGGTLRPRRDGAEALVLLRLQQRDAAAAQFLALNERIDALNREIERRRRVEDELRAQREWLEVTLTSIGDAVISTDPDARITFLNPRAEVMTGWTAADAVGRPIAEVFRIVNEETRAPVENPVAEVLATGAIVGLANHTVLISRHGDAIAIEDSAAPIREPGGATRGVVLVFHDVGDRRELERQLVQRAARLAEADRRKDEFIAMLAHELRNPLAALRSSLDVMARAPGDGPAAERLREIMTRQIGHLTRMVDDLLDVSRITRGTVVLRRDVVDLAALVRRALADHAPRIVEAALALDAELPAEPAWIDADATRIAQVVDNLLENAIKFSDAGGRIGVRVTGGAEHVELVVRDQGVGIDPDVLPTIFESFVQADRTLDRSRGGLGLGLALVKGIVELHGGTVAAASAGSGRGTELTVRFERVAAPVDAAVAAPAGGAAPPLRVLVIDDNVDVADTLAMFLETEGCTIAVAHDGPTAVDVARRFRPDVVVCDIGLPGMDGFAVARALRELPGLHDVRLLAATGYGEASMRDRVAEAGFDAHLVKPVDADALVALLRAGRVAR